MKNFLLILCLLFFFRESIAAETEGADQKTTDQKIIEILDTATMSGWCTAIIDLSKLRESIKKTDVDLYLITYLEMQASTLKIPVGEIAPMCKGVIKRNKEYMSILKNGEIK
jgi:hypothetical protein